MLDYIFFILCFIGLLFIIGLYCANVYKVVNAFRDENYNLLLISRIIGVFFPIWGLIMGLV